jgi:hypothetical protein
MSNNHTFFFILVAGTIAGSVVGGLIAIGIIVALIVYCARKSTVEISFDFPFVRLFGVR